MTPNVQEAADEIHSDLSDDADVDVDEIAEQINNLLEFSVPFDEAVQNVRNQYVDTEEMDDDREPEVLTLEEIAEDGKPVTLEQVKVVDVWDPSSDKIKQKGLIADETDRVAYTEFTGSDHPTFVEDEVYRIENARANEWQGNYGIILNDDTSVEIIDDVELDTDGANEENFMAPIVNVQSGSGLIKRCAHEDCTRVVTDRDCPDHPDAGKENDLRIKANADTGDETRKLIFDRETTEKITGMTMDDAVEMFHESMSRSVINQRITDEIFGKYYYFEGRQIGDNFLVNEFSAVDVDIKEQADDLISHLNEVNV